jgi:hypothetical protein
VVPFEVLFSVCLCTAGPFGVYEKGFSVSVRLGVVCFGVSSTDDNNVDEVKLGYF